MTQGKGLVPAGALGPPGPPPRGPPRHPVRGEAAERRGRGEAEEGHEEALRRERGQEQLADQDRQAGQLGAAGDGKAGPGRQRRGRRGRALRARERRGGQGPGEGGGEWREHRERPMRRDIRGRPRQRSVGEHHCGEGEEDEVAQIVGQPGTGASDLPYGDLTIIPPNYNLNKKL